MDFRGDESQAAHLALEHNSFNQEANFWDSTILNTDYWIEKTTPHPSFTDIYAPGRSAPGTTASAIGSNTGTSFYLNESDVPAYDFNHVIEYAPLSSFEMNPAAETGFLCDWPGCPSKEIFTSKLNRSYHVTYVHVAYVLEQWPGRCTWPGCTSKANYPSRRLLETHVTNIHTNPLHCDIPGCNHVAPFTRQGQLDRHKASIHKIGRLFKCPMRGCPRHEEGFGRKDKLNEHVKHQKHGPIHCPHQSCSFNQKQGFLSREQLEDHMRSKSHGSIHCPYNHCIFQNECGFMSTDDLQQHIISAHKHYECGILNCEGSRSGFSKPRLYFHLRQAHAFNPSIQLKAFFANLPDYQVTVTMADIDFLSPSAYAKSASTACGPCKGKRPEINPLNPESPRMASYDLLL